MRTRFKIFKPRLHSTVLPGLLETQTAWTQMCNKSQELAALSSYLRYNYYQLATPITELNESRSRFARLHRAAVAAFSGKRFQSLRIE